MFSPKQPVLDVVKTLGTGCGHLLVALVSCSLAAPRVNPVGVQMISAAMQRHLFGREHEYDAELVRQSRAHLSHHGLLGKEARLLPEIDFPLPPLRGGNIEEHFENIALEQIENYLPLLDDLMDASLPCLPEKWSYSSGWTRYEGQRAVPVNFPLEDAMVLDVEVCVSHSPAPVLAVAASPQAWYSWVSSTLTDHQDSPRETQVIMDDLIHLETLPGEQKPSSGNWRERLIVGHNVSYDRARIKEQYLLKVSVVFLLLYGYDRKPYNGLLSCGPNFCAFAENPISSVLFSFWCIRHKLCQL